MKHGVGYYPNLVEDLEQDHRALLQAFGVLKRSASASDVPAFRFALNHFHSLLTGHLLKEAVKLYIYLRQRLKHDETSYALITAYKSEMDGITKVVLGFIDGCKSRSDEALDLPSVVHQLAGIGQVLGDRIRREESELYILYHDNYD